MVSIVNPFECLKRVFEVTRRYADNLMLDAEHPRDMPLPCQLWNHRPAREAIFRIWSSQACDSDQFNIVEPLLTDSNKDDQIWPITTELPVGPVSQGMSTQVCCVSLDPESIRKCCFCEISTKHHTKDGILNSPQLVMLPHLVPTLLLTTAEAETCFPQETAAAMLLAIRQQTWKWWLTWWLCIIQ